MLADNSGSGSDSDSSSEAAPHDSQYQLVSSGVDPEDNNDDITGSYEDSEHQPHSNGGDLFHLSLPNPSILDLNGAADCETQSREEEEHEEEEIEREASIARAFRDDESRRMAPLGQENAARVMDAMRGVAFPGVPPNWSTQVPEEQWLRQLRSIRRDPT